VAWENCVVSATHLEVTGEGPMAFTELRVFSLSDLATIYYFYFYVLLLSGYLQNYAQYTAVLTDKVRWDGIKEEIFHAGIGIIHTDASDYAV